MLEYIYSLCLIRHDTLLNPTLLFSRAAFCIGYNSLVYARHGRELMG